MKRCITCLNAETRPRIEFDEYGKCNACLCAEEKKVVDWESRQYGLEALLKRHKNPAGFDCIVAVREERWILCCTFIEIKVWY